MKNATTLQIRPDLTHAHDQVWHSVARPGTWLSGAQRVAIAHEARAARRCGLCLQRKAALSPSAIEGPHERLDNVLAPATIELVHKLVTDPGRITRSWVDGLLNDDLTDAQYVETAALVSSVVVVDTFHHALGLALRELPEALPGAPSQQRPATAALEGAYVPMIPVDGLTDDYPDLYDTNRWVPSVHRAFSLVPEATRMADALMATHYLPYDLVPNYTDNDHGRALNKTQMELIASRVSLYNDCFY